MKGDLLQYITSLTLGEDGHNDNQHTGDVLSELIFYCSVPGFVLAVLLLAFAHPHSSRPGPGYLIVRKF